MSFMTKAGMCRALWEYQGFQVKHDIKMTIKLEKVFLKTSHVYL